MAFFLFKLFFVEVIGGSGTGGLLVRQGQDSSGLFTSQLSY